MANILFTHSFFYRFDPKQWEVIRQPYPPLMTITAAALMRAEGHEARLFDTNLRESPEEIMPMLADAPDYLIIYDDGFNWLTKMCLTRMRDAAFELARMGREAGATVIICSSDSSDHYEMYLDKGVDYVLLGEGELTLQALMTAFAERQDITTVQGLAFRKEGETVHTGRRGVIRDLDSLPQAAWDLIDVDSYRKVWMEAHGYFSLNLDTTRGCPYKCNWCAKPIYGNRYNVRDPKLVAEEIEMLMSRYGVDHFWMCDDIFGLKPGWVHTFRDEVKKRGLKFRYKIQSRVDLMLGDDQIEALADTGLETVWVGAESGSQKILDAMDKGTQVEQIQEATQRLQSHGVRVAFFLQFGYPGEKEEDIQKTIAMVQQCLPDEIGISVSYPLPGTKFYERVRDQLGEKANWVDSDDLDLMFVNEYQPAFYKKLHRYVHKVHRKAQGWQYLRESLRAPASLSGSRMKRILSAFYYTPAAWLDARELRKLARS